jgi:hypothetical protein
MNIYFELNNTICDTYPTKYPGRYCVKHDCPNTKHLHKHLLMDYYETLLLCDRAWLQDGDKVKFIKNRLLGPDAKVDDREFFWIILQSHTI